ncbi:hypothetical protein BDV12DRAFT_191622 [Aspergillus spectabilis]
MDSQYYPGLKVMLKYETMNDPYPDLVKIAPAVQAGYAVINHDLQKFTETLLCKWITSGLHHIQTPKGGISEQCSLDFRYLGMGLDTETKFMVRRVARVRLYYWYEEQNIAMQQSQGSLMLERGKDTRSKAIDTLLERVYDDWETADENSKKARRKEFHHHKDIGKRWCELVRYLGEGILVICGKEFDTKLANILPAHNIHALATFVVNCYPGIISIATYYQSVVRNFIRNQNLNNSQWAGWYQGINWDYVREVIKGSREPPEEPERWKQLPDHSKDANLSEFIRTCLNSPNEEGNST